jgi:peptidoglycan/xylan/chitin deacetylase (PgdA/CDA1 family)
MRLVDALRGAWRKNGPELRGLFNGAIADFVLARDPAELGEGVPVFCFHLVEADEFEADLDFLSRNAYRPVSGSALIAHLRGERRLPKRSVVLTFDDGARNFFDVAFPLLARYQMHAVAFVAPGLHADAGPGDDTDARPMSWEEIALVHRSGFVEFQSHTLESRYVPNWPAPVALAGCAPQLEAARRGSPLELGEDLEQSRQLLEHRLPGAKVDQLAFPMYIGTDAAVDVARGHGFEACYWGLIEGRALNRPGDSPYLVSRMSDEFLRRLPGEGRISLRGLLAKRKKRIQAARAWRSRFPE